MAVSDLHADFLRYLCQTGPAPMGIEVGRAAGSTIWDAQGNAYLDLLAGIGVANVGHANADVVRAVREQAGRYLHVMVYGELVEQPQVELARRLADITPGDLSVTFFTNSGAEAVEGALKTARKFTGRRRFVAFEGSFHGDTFGALSVGGNPLYRRPFEPLLPEVDFLPFGDEAALARIDERTAAVIFEPIQGEAGVRIPLRSFVTALRRRCSDVGALLLADEVITGFGRTGHLFACDGYGVVPDLLILAKALGGGLPLGAFVGRPEVMKTLSVDPPLAHVTTFGGHPLSCAAGLAALGFLERESLVRRAGEIGAVLARGLGELRGERLREVRAAGALLGLEFRAPEWAQRFVAGCLARRVIVGWTLHRDTVVRLAPPLVLSDAELERAIAVMRDAVVA
jgi:acetylornithine/succinyldiaminopimelate/putrescine aminotransferase